MSFAPPLATSFDRITFDPDVMGGQACIRGMRIPVSVILRLLAHGVPRADILEDYPDLADEDLTQSLEYAAWLASDLVVPA